MQLIVETETTLDIERNMSAIEDIQHNNIEKCNGNKEIIDINKTVEDEVNNKVISEMEEALANIPPVENDETHLSNVDLSNIINEKNNLKSNDTDTVESQKDSSENEVNGIDTAEEETVQTSKDIVEDYLENDIISLSEEPFIISDGKDDNTSNGDLEIVKESMVTEDITEEVKEIVNIENNQSKTEENNVIEVLEESDECSEKETDPIQVDKDTENNKMEDLQKQSEIVPVENTSVEKTSTNIDENGSIDINSEDTSIPIEQVPLEKQINKEMKPKLDIIDHEDIIDDEKTVECPKEKDLSIEDASKEAADVIEIDSNTVLSETKPDSLEEKEDIEILEEKDETLPIELDNKTESPSKENISENKEENSLNEETKDVDTSIDITETLAEEEKPDDSSKELKDSTMDVDEIIEEETTKTEPAPLETNKMDIENITEESPTQIIEIPDKETQPAKIPEKKSINEPVICKLSNTLDILSDDDEEEPPKETPKVESPKVDTPKVDTKCIDLDDDDDIMLIDEDTSKTEVNAPAETGKKEEDLTPKSITTPDSDEKGSEKDSLVKNVHDETTSPETAINETKIEIDIKEKTTETLIEKEPPPLVPENFLKTAKKQLSDMTRDELEEFCILKIVESVVDRSSLSDIKNKLKTMTQGLEDYRKKATMLTKQNRDLQLVLKSVQEEQKKSGDVVITPLKITRSVGMQVFMEKAVPRKKVQQNVANKTVNSPQNKTVTTPPQRQQKNNQNIPVPRLVPALNPPGKAGQNNINTVKNNTANNGIVKAEKRTFGNISASSVTVDLTDDEPPAKMTSGVKAPVRLVPSQNLMQQRPAFANAASSPRKVYIPISGPQNQNLRLGQTIMLKSVPTPGIRPRNPTPMNNTPRMNRVTGRHPAPLPLAMKQYQPPNWKSLPPAPDLKLSKVENGIVISWKIENIPEDSYEEIASYQLYAYQETASPPSTTLWKKIGDVKALPLPMACTLTQFMAGFKYYFAVRAVDIRSRLGPFSLPGSILLLNKNL